MPKLDLTDEQARAAIWAMEYALRKVSYTERERLVLQEVVDDLILEALKS